MSNVIEEAFHVPVTHKFKVRVTYNGMDKEIEVEPEETVKTLLDQAIHKFGPLPNPHLLALFGQDGRELQDGKTLREEGIKVDEHLLLRPSAVRGG